MNRVTHKYIVNIRLLKSLEKFVDENPEATIQDIKAEFIKLRLFYQCGLSKISDYS